MRSYILDTCNNPFYILLMENKPKNQEFETAIVTGSQALARPDGRFAILLKTSQGAIALEVNSTALRFLRRELDAIELMMKSKAGNA